MTHSEIEKANSSSARDLSLRIGDIGVALVSNECDLSLRIRGVMERFLVDKGQADVTLQVAWGKLRGSDNRDKIFDSGGVWQLYRTVGPSSAGPATAGVGPIARHVVGPGLAPASSEPSLEPNYLFRFTSPFYGPMPYKQARFNADFTAGEIVLHGDYFDRDQGANALEYPLDELLMVNLLARGRGVEVHACGVEDSDGRGYLFVGQSGAGKTTIARLCENAGGAQVLSDDRIILRSLDGRIWMYGTPWQGEAEFASPARAALSGIFFLRHGPTSELVPLAQAAAVARLMACSFVPFYSPSGLDSALAFYQGVTETIPCHELGFFPDSQVVEFVRNM